MLYGLLPFISTSLCRLIHAPYWMGIVDTLDLWRVGKGQRSWNPRQTLCSPTLMYTCSSVLATTLELKVDIRQCEFFVIQAELGWPGGLGLLATSTGVSRGS